MPGADASNELIVGARTLLTGRARRGAVLAAWLILGLPAAAAHGEDAAQTAVKASYLAKLAPFVDWPATAFSGPSDPLTVCVVGADPFGASLDRALAGQTVRSRAIVVRRMARASRQSGCQIMYLGGSAAQPVKDALKVMHGAPVLTVTAEAEAAGIIDLVLEGDRVRLRIDDAEAAQDGLTISSKLLGLAKSVKQRPAAGGAR